MGSIEIETRAIQLLGSIVPSNRYLLKSDRRNFDPRKDSSGDEYFYVAFDENNCKYFNGKNFAQSSLTYFLRPNVMNF